MSFLVLFLFCSMFTEKNSLFDIIIFSLNKSLCWNLFLRREGEKVEKPHVDLPECSSFYFFIVVSYLPCVSIFLALASPPPPLPFLPNRIRAKERKFSLRDDDSIYMWCEIKKWGLHTFIWLTRTVFCGGMRRKRI